MTNKIITADFHLRKSVPVCRQQTEEEWLDSQREVIRFIINEANKRKADIFILGDVFHTPRVDVSISNMLLKEALNLSENLWVYILVGNHESLGHNISLSDKTSIYPFILNNWPFKDIAIDYDGATHFGEEPKNLKSKMIFLHTLTFPSEKDMPPTLKGQTAQDLLDKYPMAKNIFVGDYHKNFIYREKDRFVLNPGCITIQSSDMIDYAPQIYFISNTGDIESILLPNDKNCISDSHIKGKKEREGRLSAFIETVKGTSRGMSLDFKDNVEKAIELNSDGLTEPQIKIINELMEGKE